MTYEVKSVNQLNALKGELSEAIFNAAMESTQLLDQYYTSVGIDGGSVLIFSYLRELVQFRLEHPYLDITEVELAKVIIQEDGTKYYNLLLMAGTEYSFNLILPAELLTQDELERIFAMVGVSNEEHLLSREA